MEPAPTREQPADEVPDRAVVAAAAWAEGFQKGYEDGLLAANEEQKEAIRTLIRLVNNALVEATQFTRLLEQQVVELSLEIAAKIIEREALVDRSIVLSVVHAALAEIQQATSAHIRVHPEDYEALARHWEGMVPRPLAGHSELLVDEHVQPGGCLIELQIGRVDAQLATKLAQVVNTFHALLEGEPI